MRFVPVENVDQVLANALIEPATVLNLPLGTAILQPADD